MMYMTMLGQIVKLTFYLEPGQGHKSPVMVILHINPLPKTRKAQWNQNERPIPIPKLLANESQSAQATSGDLWEVWRSGTQPNGQERAKNTRYDDFQCDLSTVY